MISDTRELNAIKIIESIDGNEIKNCDKLDYAKFLNLRGLIYMENGYNSKALTNFNLANINFKEVSQDPFDPYLINNKYDQIVGMCLFTDNFYELKNELLELISMSQLLNIDYLIIKGFVSLSNFYGYSGNFRHSFNFSRYAWELIKKKNFNSNLLINKMLYLSILNIELSRNTVWKDEIFKKINSENNSIIKQTFDDVHNFLIVNQLKTQNPHVDKTDKEKNNNKNSEEEKEKMDKTNVYRNPIHVSQILYFYGDYFFSTRSLYKGLYFTEKAIEYLEKNNYFDLHLILYYIKKWVILSHMGREDTAEYIIEYSQKLINQYYSPDSLKNLEYLRYVQIYSATCDPPRIDIVNEIIKKTKKVQEVDNVNSLLTKFYNILSLLNCRAGVPELIEIYKEFDKLEKLIFDNKITELRTDLKWMLRMSRMSSIMKIKS